MNLLKIFRKRNFDNPWKENSKKYILENAGQDVNCETALMCPPYVSSINIISTSIAKLSKHVLLDGKRIKGHQIEKLLRNPNPFMDGYTLIQQAEKIRLNEGNSYILIDRDNQGYAKQLWLVNSDVRLEKDGYYKLNINGSQRVIHPNDMIHLKTNQIDLENFKGIGYSSTLRRQIGLWLAAQSYQSTYFANGSKPNGIIALNTELNEEMRNKVRDAWEENHSKENKNKVAVMPKGMEFKETSLSNFNDLQMKDTFNELTKQIASVFNLSPYMIGHDGTSNTYSNIESQNIHFLQQTLMPLIISWEQQLTKLFPSTTNIYVKFNYESLLRADSLSRANRLKILVDSEIMSKEEARTMEGLS
ncbi:MAG: phage portal protein [Paraclostridium sp.]